MSDPIVKVSSDTGCGVFAAAFLLIIWASIEINNCRENPVTVRIEVHQVDAK
jgi:hypothetical protein